MQNASTLDSQWQGLLTKVSGVIDLEASARAAGALSRRREIKSGEALLRLALAYGPGGLSLRSSALWAGVNGLADLSDTAVMNRLRRAGDWLGDIAGALLRRAPSPPPSSPSSPSPRPAGLPPAVLPGRPLRLIDGSVVTQPGSRGTDWRLHATYDPAAGRFTDLELGDRHGAESLARAKLAPGDVAVADSGYARPGDLRSVLERGADFIVRTAPSKLRLLRPHGGRLDWPAVFAGLEHGAVADYPVLIAPGRRGAPPPFAARLIVLRLSEAAAARARQRVLRKHSKTRAGATLRPLTLQAAGFLLLLTSLPPPVGATEVLAAYRLRWQVELAFKRLKSLGGLDRLPAKSRPLARSWLLAHLILALLIDAAGQDVLESPPSAPRHAAWGRLDLAGHAAAA